jgi:hypothetical protein
MPRHISAVLLSVALLALPLTVAIEHARADIWSNRLLVPLFSPTINRHTPLQPIGYILPPTLKTNQTLPADQLIILTKITRIPKGVTIIIPAGVDIYVHEFGQLVVEGELKIEGTSQQPVSFLSNELHPDNQVWGGIVFEAGSRGQVTHTRFEYASPAVSCLAESRVALDHIGIRFGSVGIFTTSSLCQITNSQIEAVRDGIIAQGFTPTLLKTTINASHQNLIVQP